MSEQSQWEWDRVLCLADRMWYTFAEVVIMGYSLNVKLPDELRELLLQVATGAGQTPEEWVVAVVRQQLAKRDEKLRRHFGAVNLGAPTGVDNTKIDADLVRAYAGTHQEL